jgi:hypothetical protein
MIEQAFEVATEFRFDVGQALINTKALQGAVDGVAQSAGAAVNTLNYLASGLVARLGFGSGGLLTVLSKAVSLSEDFDQVSLGFSNTITSNMKVLTGTINTFNDRLETSQMILDKISDTAIKFAIPTGDLARLTNLIATPLAQKGKLGMNFGNAIEMSKNLMLGSETVGLHPQIAGESLYRALTDHMPLHGALFARLVNTQAFKSGHVTTQAQLQSMNPEKKIDLLSNALRNLAMDTDAINYRLGSLRGQMIILRDMFTDLGSVLRPIGDAIKKPLAQVLRTITGYLQTNGKEIGKHIGALLANVLQDPKELLISLLQFRTLGRDFKRSLHLVELYGTLKFVQFILMRLGVTFNGGLIRYLFTSVYEGLKALFGIIPFGRIFGGVMMVLRAALVEILPVFLAALFIFQTISRARALAKLDEVQNAFDLAPKFAALFTRLKVAISNIMLPITILMDDLAHLIAPLFDASFWIKVLVPVMEAFTIVLEYMGKATVYALAGINAISYALVSFVDDLIHLKNPFTHSMDNLKKGFDDFLEENRARLGGDKIKATANYVNNIGKIEARFDMREQLEPDRIAFAVTDHLKRLASNPTQSRGNTLSRHVTGSMAFAGGK